MRKSIVVIFSLSLWLAMNASAAGSAVADSVKLEKLQTRLKVACAKAMKDVHAPVIHPAELIKLMSDTDLVLIDIRQPKEQEVSMLPHAITTFEFADKFRHGLPASKRIVVYCTIGYRSGKYAEELAKQGIKSENLEGGILAWTFAGGTVFAKDQNGESVRTNRVHVYDKEWNILPPEFVGVW